MCSSLTCISNCIARPIVGGGDTAHGGRPRLVSTNRRQFEVHPIVGFLDKKRRARETITSFRCQQVIINLPCAELFSSNR